MKLKELREKRSELLTEIKGIRDKIASENRARTEEETKRWDEVETELATINDQIQVLERGDEVDRFLNQRRDNGAGRGRAPGSDGGSERPLITDEQRCLSIQAWMRRNGSRKLDLRDEHVSACEAAGIDPNAEELVIRLHDANRMKRMRSAGFDGGYGRSYQGAEGRALSAVVGASGGYLTAPEEMVNNIEVNMLAYGGILQAAQVIRTAGANEMSWPTFDDTSNTGRQVGENAAVTATAEPFMGKKSWGAYKFTSDEILVPTELLEETPFDLPGLIGEALGERLGRILSTKFTTGSGAATPLGIVNSAAAATLSTGVATTASATAITWDEITDLIHSLNPAYRQGAAFMFSDAVYQHLRKLKDAAGRPLWAEGPNSTPPATLQGHPYYINHDMASSIIASATTMLFGRLSQYKVRQVREIRMYRLVERHRENDQDAFLAFIRADGGVLQSNTPQIRKLVQHA